MGGRSGPAEAGDAPGDLRRAGSSIDSPAAVIECQTESGKVHPFQGEFETDPVMDFHERGNFHWSIMGNAATFRTGTKRGPDLAV